MTTTTVCYQNSTSFSVRSITQQASSLIFCLRTCDGISTSEDINICCNMRTLFVIDVESYSTRKAPHQISSFGIETGIDLLDFYLQSISRFTVIGKTLHITVLRYHTFAVIALFCRFIKDWEYT